MKVLVIGLIGSVLGALGQLGASTFFCDPVNGSVENAGTASEPWGSWKR